LRSIRFLDLLWLAYLLFTAALFHVELRYRLPFLVALIPYAAVVLAHPRATWAGLRRRWPRLALAAAALLALAGLLLAHANYPLLSYRVAAKRVRLVLGEGALARGDVTGAEAHARAAIAVYEESSEARVLLARVLWLEGKPDQAETALRQAIDYRSGHPHPHLLLGDLLRAENRAEEAVSELAYERNSLEDLQCWLWERAGTPVPKTLDLGTGLELGFVHGWHLPETTGDGTTFRWTDESVTFRLAAPGGDSAPLQLTLRLAAGRPEGEPLPQVEVYLEGKRLGAFTVENGWHTYNLEIPAVPPGSILLFELRSTTFRPHAYDPHLDDNRALGVMGEQLSVCSYQFSVVRCRRSGKWDLE
jgi:tetratricopeptide (TPR) repeat protein